MFSIRKTLRRDHLAETIVIIISIHEVDKLHFQISDNLKFAKSTLISIIHHNNRQSKHQLRSSKRGGWSFKLDNRAKRLFIRHIKQNLHNYLKALGTPSKSGQTFS